MDNLGDAVLGTYIIIILAFIIGLIVAFILLVKKSSERSKASEANINRMLMTVPQDKQMIVMSQFQNTRKNPTTAIVLALFLGGLGAHKFYLNQVGLGIVYLLFSWSGIPMILGFIEAFFIAGKVSEMNEKSASQFISMFGR